MVYRLGYCEVNLFKLGIIQNSHRPEAGLLGCFGWDAGPFQALTGRPVLVVHVGPYAVEVRQLADSQAVVLATSSDLVDHRSTSSSSYSMIPLARSTSLCQVQARGGILLSVERA